MDYISLAIGGILILAGFLAGKYPRNNWFYLGMSPRERAVTDFESFGKTVKKGLILLGLAVALGGIVFYMLDAEDIWISLMTPLSFIAVIIISGRAARHITKGRKKS